MGKSAEFFSVPAKSASVSYEELLKEYENGKPMPEKPSSLPRTQIKWARGVFQPREMGQDIYQGEKHIKALMQTIKGKKDHQLDPIMVWWGGKHWYVIDGHHRLEAYLRLAKGEGLKKPIKVDINVEVFEGTPLEAVAYARKANSVDKRPMSNREKTDAGWRLTVLSEMERHAGRKRLSKSHIHEATTVSNGTLGAMRNVLEERLKEGFTIQELLDMRWRDVRAGTEPKTEDEIETQLRKRIEQAAIRLNGVFGPLGRNDPRLVAEAIISYRPEMPRELSQTDEWQWALGDDSEELDI